MNNNGNSNANGLAVAGLVLGIVSLVFAFLYTWIGLIAGIVGIILSVKGRVSVEKRGIATAGLVCSIIGTALSGIFIACALCVVGTAIDAINDMSSWY